MIVARFAVQCRPDSTEEVAEVVNLVAAGALTRDPEWTVRETSAAG